MISGQGEDFMKAEKNILIALILNLFFAVFEFAGGICTGSTAVISDAVHDIGDAASIGISYVLEKKSRRLPDEKYTYGYARYSVIGGAITTGILLFGSVMVIFNAVSRILEPAEIHYNGMAALALIGACVNFCAALFTRDGESLNQKAVNLHMFEDVLGWIVVLVGAIIMRFTDLSIIDPLMSIGAAVFVLVNVIGNLKEIADLLLEKIPEGMNLNEIKEHISGIEGVLDVHHIHIWSIDYQSVYATMHIVTETDSDAQRIKEKVRAELLEYGIVHVTIELESNEEHCHEKNCCVKYRSISFGHHHHHSS